MKTTVIILISLVFMIPSLAFADGGDATAPKGDVKTTVSVEQVAPMGDLIVVNLNDQIDNYGLPQDILDQFQDVMAYPEDVVNAGDKECVMVEFSYDDEGFVTVNNTSSTNESFSDHVITNIEKIRLRNGSVTIGKNYYAKFSFKKL